MKDLTETQEIGSDAGLVRKILKIRMRWAGHLVRMKDELSPKRAETQKQVCRKNEEDHSYDGRIV